jgi:hypothetical protein
MIIEFERSGGFGGMLVSTRIDTDDLNPEAAEELIDLVRSTGYFDLPEEESPRSIGADMFQYKVRIEDEARALTLEMDDGGVSDVLRPLLRQLTLLARKVDSSE